MTSLWFGITIDEDGEHDLTYDLSNGTLAMHLAVFDKVLVIWLYKWWVYIRSYTLVHKTDRSYTCFGHFVAPTKYLLEGLIITNLQAGSSSNPSEWSMLEPLFSNNKDSLVSLSANTISFLEFILLSSYGW